MIKIRPLFSKYQKYLLAFANTKFGRDYLNAKDMKIAYVSPDGLHYKTGENEYLGVFYPKSVYLKKFRLALEGLSIVEEAGLKIKEKFEYVIPHFQELIAPVRFLPNIMRLTLADKYPDADPETTTVDGIVRYEEGANWDTAHNAATGTGAFPSAASESLNNARVSASDWRVNRGFALFDTSSLPDGCTVTSAIFSIMPITKVADADTHSYGIVQSSPASNTNLTTADFDACGDTHSPTEGATRIAYTSLTVDVYADFSLNSTGLTWISKTGVTKIGIRGSKDLDDSAPTGTNDTIVYFADTAGTSADPKISVSYSVPVCQAIIM